MKLRIFILFLYLPLIFSEKWSRYLKLDQNYEVWWNVERDEIIFQLEVATKGWIGFGISLTGEMTGSDVVIGWVKNGSAQFHDRHAKGRFQPEIDKQQDWEYLWCCENDTHTIIRFKRLLNTCDYQDIRITNNTINLIYAYSNEVPNSENSVKYHGPRRRGSKKTFLLNPRMLESFENEENIYYWELKSHNIPVPSNKISGYYCILFKRPDLDKKHHIIEIDPIIQPGNENIVYNLVLYSCPGINEEKISQFTEKKYHECFTEEMEPKFPFYF
ncbi:DBH-like monooxygenase protein 1 homolog [Centruroides sculpturatus]|uniref:DBH-like monooxygenase protein 1 homolog n=1 Tax=Centruroides sculpturatus TaxID=218467 RepID=UPI000C6DE3E2|nr:DBH-like monooxygenase protein 1 homolog [Centruroides sculpturatus]